MISKIMSFVITSLALVYLTLIPLGIIDKQNRRFGAVDLGIIVSILVINSDKLSKLKFGKEGFSVELLEEVKESQIQIQNQQKQQNQELTQFKEIFQTFLKENHEVIEKLKYIKLPDSPEALAKIIAEYTLEEIRKHPPSPKNILRAIASNNQENL